VIGGLSNESMAVASNNSGSLMSSGAIDRPLGSLPV
jgi:hypothetical protein